MNDQGLNDGVVQLRDWADDDAAWYAESARDPEIQRFTTDPSTLDAAQVLAAINRMRASDREVGFVICDSITGAKLGNIALAHDGRVGELSYWLAAEARGRGVVTRALTLITSWAVRHIGLVELRLWAHQDNLASQRVALRAGYLRDPDRDKAQEAKGAVWPMHAFVLVPTGA
ncbi:GNAT family N-acetyltransferase [Streptosporangium sandarakinum]